MAELALAEMYQKAQTKQRMIGEFDYAAGSWNRPRRVIARLEHAYADAFEAIRQMVVAQEWIDLSRIFVERTEQRVRAGGHCG